MAVVSKVQFSSFDVETVALFRAHVATLGITPETIREHLTPDLSSALAQAMNARGHRVRTENGRSTRPFRGSDIASLLQTALRYVAK